MVGQIKWKYRIDHPAEFPFACEICRPAIRIFKTEQDKANHDKMTKRHDPGFVSRNFDLMNILHLMNAI